MSSDYTRCEHCRGGLRTPSFALCGYVSLYAPNDPHVHPKGSPRSSQGPERTSDLERCTLQIGTEQCTVVHRQ